MWNYAIVILQQKLVEGIDSSYLQPGAPITNTVNV